MFAALQGANVDWNVVAGAFATFVVTAIATAFGFRKGFKRLKEHKTEQVHIAGATLMDNMSMHQLTEAIRENTELHRQIHGCLLEIKVMLTLAMNNRRD
jgi:putative Mn2+ efflux pump MntP